MSTVVEGIKLCYRCETVKPIEDFSRHAGRPDGLRADCKVCAAEAVAEWRCRNPNKVKDGRRAYHEKHRDTILPKLRENNFLRNYGMSKADVEQLRIKQHGCCRLCHLPFGKGSKAAVVDHNHKTGRVRGLIHSNCNCMLGFAGDSVSRLRAAIDYLEADNG